MPRYAAFLRGMNVGGHRLSNAELVTHFSAMGLAEVGSFRASGNVVFATTRRASQALQELIEGHLAESLGYAVPAFIRAAEEVRAIAAARPFDAPRLRASPGKLQVALLAEPASAPARAEALAAADGREGLAFGERELYWLPSAGVLDSALDMKMIERLLGPMTMRTKGTIEQLAERHFEA